jgi:glyoxalase family protein
VLVSPSAHRGKLGAGIVHHLAFHARSDAEQQHWAQLLDQRGIAATKVRDRQYFRSIYFREPGGVLLEIATDQPGFAIDESPATLGHALKLPPMYEHARPRIEAALVPIAIATRN